MSDREKNLAFLAKSLEDCTELHEEIEFWNQESGQDGLEHV